MKHLLLALLVMLSATCGAVQPDTTNVPQRSITVTLHNRNWQDARVYVSVYRGTWVRLGTVTTGNRVVRRVPVVQQGSVRFKIHLIGGGGWVTEELLVEAGDDITLSIAHRLQYTYVVPWTEGGE